MVSAALNCKATVKNVTYFRDNFKESYMNAKITGSDKFKGPVPA